MFVWKQLKFHPSGLSGTANPLNRLRSGAGRGILPLLRQRRGWSLIIRRRSVRLPCIMYALVICAHSLMIIGNYNSKVVELLR